MRQTLALLAAATLAMTVAAPAVAGGRPFDTALLGANEVPGPGDPDGSGAAAVTVNPGQEEACFTLTVSDVEPILAAHIHRGTADVAGPVVVDLAPTFVDGTATGCVTVERGLAREILRDPDGFYVNVHNASFPAGALRGQL
jgi:hypothetical protein